jgi:acetylornithine deacetylase/succinyl-diaminopimelate desuccinylase family protein
MARHLCDLIAIETENPPGNNYRRFAAAFRSLLRSFHFEHVPQRDLATVVLAAVGPGKRPLYFHGHYDVVPANSRGQFAPKRVRRSVFGRGSSDMKGGLISMVYAMRAIHEACPEFGGAVRLCCVPDEETGGLRGSQALVRRKLLGRDGIGMLTAEPTGGAIWNANRGALSLSIRVRGRPAHVGLHYRGINAFEGMLRIAAGLGQVKRAAERRRTRCPIEPEEARKSILLLGGTCEGGSNFNVVPESCTFTVDRRINPEERIERERERIFAALEEAKRAGVKFEVKLLQEAESAISPPGTALGRALSSSVADITRRKAPFSLCPGLLETRFYAKRGIPAYAYGPGLLTVSHGPNEFVPERNLVECASVYALTALRLFGSA